MKIIKQTAMSCLIMFLCNLKILSRSVAIVFMFVNIRGQIHQRPVMPSVCQITGPTGWYVRQAIKRLPDVIRDIIKPNLRLTNKLLQIVIEIKMV